MMNSPAQLFSFIFLVLFLSGQVAVRAEARMRHNLPTKLFVFGDSYVDTGNTRKDQPGAWKEPYGITFPGKPAGRFSDGRVFTDFIAKYLGLKSPVPYFLREQYPQNLKYGMNFAVGGTGVIGTKSPPNMTAQIDFFQKLIEDKVYNASDLNNSVAYVSVAGNDYIQHYLAPRRPILGFPSFIASVVNQTITNLIRIHALGVKKVVVGGLQPLGCLPVFSVIFQHCEFIIDDLLVEPHNKYLQERVTKLNQQAMVNTTFLIIDLYDSFKSVLDHPKTYNFHDLFVPCCVGTSLRYVCGSVDNNETKYKVCDNPKTAFFWDPVHPTQAGWHAVYNKLQTMNALDQLRY